MESRMESCCDWASLSRHGGRAKHIFSRETGAEAVFAQISSIFKHTQIPQGNPRGRKRRPLWNNPLRAAAARLQGPVRAATAMEHRREK